MLLLYVAIGGAFGSVMRYLTVSWMGDVLGKDYPYGTITVNIIGTFILGIVIGFLADMMPRGRELHALVAIGALGGFTTFSAFSLDLYMMLERGQYVEGALYVSASVILSVCMLFFGMWLFKSIAW